MTSHSDTSKGRALALRLCLKFDCTNLLREFPWSYVVLTLNESAKATDFFFFLDKASLIKSPPSGQTSFTKTIDFYLERQPTFLYLHLYGGWIRQTDNLLLCKTIQTTRFRFVQDGTFESGINLCGDQEGLQLTNGVWSIKDKNGTFSKPLAELPLCPKEAMSLEPELKSHMLEVQRIFYENQAGFPGWKYPLDDGNNISNEITVLGAKTPGDLYMCMLAGQAQAQAARLFAGRTHQRQKREKPSKQLLYWSYCFKQACLRKSCFQGVLSTLKKEWPKDFSEFYKLIALRGTSLASARLCMELFIEMIRFPALCQDYSSDLRLGKKSDQHLGMDDGLFQKSTPTKKGLNLLQQSLIGAQTKSLSTKSCKYINPLTESCEKFEPLRGGLGRTDDCESLSMQTLINYTHFMTWTRSVDCDLRLMYKFQPELTCCVILLQEHYHLAWMNVVIRGTEDKGGKALDVKAMDVSPFSPSPLIEKTPLPKTKKREKIDTSHATLGLISKHKVLSTQNASKQVVPGQQFYLIESTGQFVGDNFWSHPSYPQKSSHQHRLPAYLQDFYVQCSGEACQEVEDVLFRAGGADFIKRINSLEWARSTFLRVCNFLIIPYTEGICPSSSEELTQNFKWYIPCRVDASGRKTQGSVSFSQFAQWAGCRAEGPHKTGVFVDIFDVIKYEPRLVSTTLARWEEERPPLQPPLSLPRKTSLRALQAVDRLLDLHETDKPYSVWSVTSVDYITHKKFLQNVCKWQLRELLYQDEAGLYGWPLCEAEDTDGWFWRQTRGSESRLSRLHYLKVYHGAEAGRRCRPNYS